MYKKNKQIGVILLRKKSDKNKRVTVFCWVSYDLKTCVRVVTIRFSRTKFDFAGNVQDGGK